MKRLFLLTAALALLLAGCAERSDDDARINAQSPASQASSASGEAALSPQVEAVLPDVSAQAPALSHSTSVPPPTGDLVEIDERLFIALTNDIYINTEDYLGKTIKYEGLFKTMQWPQGDEEQTIYYVIRYGPGCCGYDGEAGFEIVWEEGDGDIDWPQVDDWCEVVGVLEIYELDGWEYLRLVLSSLTVLEERGAEFVST